MQGYMPMEKDLDFAGCVTVCDACMDLWNMSVESGSEAEMRFE